MNETKDSQETTEKARNRNKRIRKIRSKEQKFLSSNPRKNKADLISIGYIFFWL